MIGICLTIGALLCVAIAYSPYVALLYVEFGIQGVAETFIAIGEWDEKQVKWVKNFGVISFVYTFRCT